MTSIGFGDLAGNLALRRQNAQLKADLNRLGMESTTGRTADLSARLGGDHRAAAGMQRSLTVLTAYAAATTEAGLIASTMQSSVGVIQGALSGMTSSVFTAATSESESILSITATEAEARFRSAVGAINSQVTGRSVFSGVSTGPALAPAEDILFDLKAALGVGYGSASDLVAAVDAWFDDPAGFGAQYMGSDTPLADFQVGPGESTRLDVTAMDPALRDALKAMALATLAGDSAVITSGAERRALMQSAGEAMMTADTGLAALGGRIGTGQERIATNETRNSAETLSLKIALSTLTEVDQYEAAVLMEAADQQLNTLYAVTARLTKLSLTDYL